MTKRLYLLGRWCAEHGWLVIACWVIALVSVGVLNKALPGAAQSTFSLTGTDSTAAQTLINQAFPGASGDANPIVLHDDKLDFRTDHGKQAITNIAHPLSKLSAVADVSDGTTDPTATSKDGHTTLISVTVNNQASGKPETADLLLDTAKEKAPETASVALGGYLGSLISKPQTELSEVLGLTAALIVLYLTLRRFSAMFIPLINALMAVGIGLTLIQVLARLVYIPDTAPTLGTMLGLGVGIDYALFLVTRHRKLLAAGYSVPDAVGRTTGTAGAGMVFAGGTLIAAVVGLVFTGITFLAWLGVAAAIVVALAVFASATLVPALLGVNKHRILPKNMQDLDPDHEELDNTRWARLADAVTSKPWRYAITSTIVLLLLAAPTTSLTLGHTDAGNLPASTTAKQAYDLISQGFGPGENGPLAVTVQLYSPATAPSGKVSTDGLSGSRNSQSSTGDPRTQDPRLIELQHALERATGVASVQAPVVSTDGGVAIIRVNPTMGAADPQTAALVEELRTTTLPQATQGQGMQAYVGGVTALITDLSHLIAKRTAVFIFGVVALAFVLLMLAYRSLLIPFKAAVMNLLSIAAAYGVVTMVFQWGWGIKLIGLDGPVPIESYVPMMMFAVLFGLSMDYEVFLLTAFREHWERTGDMVVSVRRGLADTGRLVTAAALIMVVVFGSFILSDNAVVKMFGVGLATAVAVDASIVRCLLVPAIMVLAAKGTWWLPDWLDRLLPQVHVEGDPAALEEMSLADRPKSDSGPVIMHRPVAAVAAVAGVIVGWFLISRIPWLPSGSNMAIALSAVLGAVVFLLPTSDGHPQRTFTRGLAYTIGVIVGIVTSGLLAAIVPPVGADSGAITTGAILLAGLIVVLVFSRRLALPIMLGAIAVAITIGLMGSSPAIMVLLTTCLAPAALTMTVAAIIGLIVSGRQQSEDSTITDSESSDSDAVPVAVAADSTPIVNLDQPSNPDAFRPDSGGDKR